MTTMRLIIYQKTSKPEELYRTLADNLLEAKASEASYRFVWNGLLILMGGEEKHAQTASVTAKDGKQVLLWTDLYGEEHTTPLELVDQVRAYWI